MNLELFLATITSHFLYNAIAKATAEQVSYCKLRLASCGIASVPPPRHISTRGAFIFISYSVFLINFDWLLAPTCRTSSGRRGGTPMSKGH